MTNLIIAILSVFAGATTQAETKKAQTDPILWDAWYTVTVNKTIHASYYNEHVELKKDRVHFQTHVWKQEEDFINEEQMGAFAQKDEFLTPLFYNFHSTYRSTETTIDGTVDEKRLLTIKTKRNGADLPIVRKSLPKKAIFSQFFPLWLGMHLTNMKPEQIAAFTTVMEDNIDDNFSTSTGHIRLEKPDTLATSSKTRKVTVTYRDIKSTWWVDDKGAAFRIEMPATGQVIERVPKENAIKFFGGS